MSRPTLLVSTAACIVVLVIALAACSDGSGDAGEPSTTSTTTSEPTTTTISSTTTTSTTTSTTTTTVPPDVVAVAAILDPMTDRELAQQLLVLGGTGAVEAALLEGVGDPCVGGVFVTESSENWLPVGSADAARAAIDQLREAASGCAAPPLVATDAEVGTQVLRVPVAPLPDAGTLEANHLAEPGTTSVGLAPAAESFATELAELGIDVNFGVVADVDAGDGVYMARRNRSFGADPSVVSAITEALVEGHCAAGVAPTLKHFPNQGSTVEDPHVTDSFSVNDPATWAGFGAVPYQSTRSPLVMVGHVRYADIDDGLPATLSPTIVGGWLREGLGYDGVVVTDDLLAMRGVGTDLSAPERAVSALRAGADLVLFVDADEGESIVDAIADAMTDDPAFATAARERAARVVRLKGALGLLPEADPGWFDLCGSAE